jgi:predicted nucleic acid-binding protein
MILVDTSIWIDHLRQGDAHLLDAVRRVPGTKLWTRDKRLLAVSSGLSLSHLASN